MVRFDMLGEDETNYSRIDNLMDVTQRLINQALSIVPPTEFFIDPP
jgi:hypothetical protein